MNKPESARTAPTTSESVGLIQPSDYEAPMPTQRTMKMRTNLPVQAYRFGVVSLKMMRMIIKSHG